MMTVDKIQSGHAKQRGAVLVVSLLVLLVLTLIGVSSLDNSVLEEKMASNAQTSTTTFQKAETSIRQAFYAELANPAGAVDAKRVGEAAVDRSDAAMGITSSSRLIYDPTAPTTAPGLGMGGSSATLFEDRHLQIVGTANVGGIRSRNIQGYKVTNMMRSQ